MATHDIVNAARRVAIADGWVTPYAAAIADILMRQWGDAAAAAHRTMNVQALGYRFAQDYADIQRPMLTAALMEGYDWASLEFPGLEAAALRRMEAKADPLDFYEIRGIAQARFGPPIEKFLGHSSEAMSKTTIKRMIGALDEGIRAEEAPYQLARRLLEYAEAHVPGRAVMVARTSTIWAMNGGARMRYRDAGVETLEWFVTDDDRTCDFCLPMDGVRVSAGGAFFQEGDTISGLPNADGESREMAAFMEIENPPLHQMCRCVILPVMD